MLEKVRRHLRDGTLLKVVRTKVRHTFRGNRGRGDRYYGQEAAAYEANRQGKAYWDDQQRITEELLARYPDGITVLDVPFGTGRFLPTYVAKDMRVLGIEASQEMLDAAAAARPDLWAHCDARVGDARRLPFEDGSVDLVVCYRFLTEIISMADARTVLAEVARVTRGGALLDLGFHDPAEGSPRRPRDRDRMGVGLTRPEVEALLLGHGLRTVEVVPCYRSGEGTRAAFRCERVST